MNNTIWISYAIISVAMAVIDMVVAYWCISKKNKKGKLLGTVAVLSALVDIFYLLSITFTNRRLETVMSSCYFASIDWLLLCLILFIDTYTHRRRRRFSLFMRNVVLCYAIFDTLTLLINPFWEISFTLISRNTDFACYMIGKYPLYWIHLIYAYMMLASIMVRLLICCIHAPAKYRNQYIYIITGLILIILINAVFLYIPGNNALSLLDCSIMCYSVELVLIYWSAFQYAAHDMLKGLSMDIFGNINQGIVVFDYEGILLMKNKKADSILRTQIVFEEEMSIAKFQRQCGFSAGMIGNEENFSIQQYMNVDGRFFPVRCDACGLQDDKGRTLGRLFVFTDIAMETDLLTGFHNWTNFQHNLENRQFITAYPMGVAIFNINNLSVLNSTYGREHGDRLLQDLAFHMHEIFPEETYYVREDANLYAIWYGADREILEDYAWRVSDTCPEGLQFGIGFAPDEDTDLMKAFEEASRSLHTKKLLDSKSLTSQALTSLIRAMQETDNDTESHVRRTRKMGRLLGKELGLTDTQQSELSLLCLLHDIGKIGIPLEILNQPGPLSKEQWVIMQSHVEKGYEIANSSADFRNIAEAILHHHERWDGKGYPTGLSRESIPYLSRVISVVDAFDAMVSDRIYRKRKSREAAVEELRQNAGTQFDPHIVSAMIQMLKEHPAIGAGKAEDADRADTETKMSAPTDTEPHQKNSHSIPHSRYLLDLEHDSRIMQIDSGFETLTGYTEEDIRNETIRQIDLIPEEDRVDYLLEVQEQLGRNGIAYMEHQLVRKDGRRIYVICLGKMFYDSVAKARRSEIVIMDCENTIILHRQIEEERAKSRQRLEEWEKIYRLDSLTGLMNHAAFENDLDHVLLEGQCKVLFLMMDVDHFKEYNDTFGHEAGDACLKKLAVALQDSLRGDDYACRMGGDEFSAAMMFKPDAEDSFIQTRASQVLDRILSQMKSLDGFRGISMGGTIQNSAEERFHDLYSRADSALYASKEKGGCQLTFAPEQYS